MVTGDDENGVVDHAAERDDLPRRYRIVGGPTGLGVEVLALRYTGTAANLRALAEMIGVQLQTTTEFTVVFTESPLGRRQVGFGEWAEVPVHGPVRVRWIEPERFAEWYALVEDDQAAADPAGN